MTTIRLDQDWLASIGLGELTPTDADDLLSHIAAELELRVGQAIAETLSEAQVAEFEGLIDSGDEQAGLAWLQQNAPAYPQIVAAEWAKIQDDVRAGATDILAVTREARAGA